MNDRLLAIWYGLGFYHFTTCSSADSNPNLAKNIDTPDDIEGMIFIIKDDNDIFGLSHLRFQQYQI